VRGAQADVTTPQAA